jgi:hypothetical protein
VKRKSGAKREVLLPELSVFFLKTLDDAVLAFLNLEDGDQGEMLVRARRKLCLCKRVLDEGVHLSLGLFISNRASRWCVSHLPDRRAGRVERAQEIRSTGTLTGMIRAKFLESLRQRFEIVGDRDNDEVVLVTAWPDGDLRRWSGATHVVHALEP